MPMAFSVAATSRWNSEMVTTRAAAHQTAAAASSSAGGAPTVRSAPGASMCRSSRAWCTCGASNGLQRQASDDGLLYPLH